MPDHASSQRGLAAAVRTTALVAVLGMGAAGCASSDSDGTAIGQAPAGDEAADAGEVSAARAGSQDAVPADGVGGTTRNAPSDGTGADAPGTGGTTAGEVAAGTPVAPQPADPQPAEPQPADPQPPQWSPPVRDTVNVRVTYRPVAGSGEQVFAWHGTHQSLQGPGVTYYFRDGMLFACTRGNPAVVCVEAPPQDSHLAPFDDVYTALVRRPGLAVRHTEDTVAGRSVTCPALDVEAARAIPSLDPDSGHTACLDLATGLVLRLTSERDGLLMEAADVVGSTAADVELPAPPLPLPVD